MFNITLSEHFKPLRNHSDGLGHVALRVAFGAISLAGCLGNSLLCYLILKNKKRLTSSYNAFIFSLAVTDLLTDIFLSVTPAFVVSPSFFKFSTHSFAGEVFCRVIGSKYIVYSLCKVSAFTVTAMAIERWYAVVRPLHYRITVTRRRVIICIVTMWFLGFSIQTPVIFEMSVDKLNKTCAWVSPRYNKQPMITCSTLITFFIPMTFTWSTCIHVVLKLKPSPLATSVGRHYMNPRLRMKRTCKIVALLLTICWLPNQIYYFLSYWGLLVLETPLHKLTTVLVMLRSCVNPFIYSFRGWEYKR